MRIIRLFLPFFAVFPLLAAVNFQHDVRPILSDNCFLCHGPDPETRLAGMRLDTKEGAFAKRDNGTPIVPGDAAASLIYQRITATDARHMPPEYSHRELTPEQIETIKAWIDEGAPWKEHWAFRTPEKPEPPSVSDESWVRNPIDRFILARLDKEGLKPAPEADRRTLARRVSLDLTGLPPTPEEVEAFVDDKDPKAYENLIDRMLAKPAYGENRARYWLDAARYADTHGMHIDNYREMWPYRDWVIKAFNENMSFDRFTIEQLAGDLLPNPTQDQLVATGFQRCNITTNEGGVIEKEVEEIYAKDRAETVGTVWLGLTVGCATCHDHKFDPITQKDFYSLGAFFRNTTQPILDGNVYDTPPVLLVVSDEDRGRWEALKTELPAARADLARIEAQNEKKAWKSVKKEADSISTDRYDGSEVFSLDRAMAETNPPKGDEASEGPVQGVSGVKLADKAYLEFKDFDAIKSDRPFTIAAWFRLDDDKSGMIAGQVESVGGDINNDERGWQFEISGGRPALQLIGEREFELGLVGDKDTPKAEEGEWHHVVATYDGKRRRDGMHLYFDGEPVQVKTTGRAIHQVEGEIGRAVPLNIGGRIGSDGDVVDNFNGAISDFRILNREATPVEAKVLYGWADIRALAAKKPKKVRDELEEYYLTREYEPYRQAMERVARLEAERRDIISRNPLTFVMHEQEDSKPMAHVLYRGMYDQPRDEAPAATPGVLPPMAEDLPRNRMGLAKWLMDDQNPLTARVTVNRMWQEVFGSGIVLTAEDFGSQGQAPINPELLDWLAVDFRESGWNMKAFYKQLLMSAAYRQSAATTPQKLEKDPKDRLLSRGPRFRMDGEVLRDYALAASGLLNDKIGGRSVLPYQPDGVWESVAMRQSNTKFYEPDTGEALYRRSLYTFWKRAAPPPSMLTFDAPTRESCTVRRERTNTPLQALVTMNDPQFFEAARRLAENAQSHAKDLDGRIDFMAERLLSRPLEEREVKIIEDSYRDFLRHYDSDLDDAKQMLAVGESKPDLSHGPAELAALTMTANQMLNLDEVLNK